MWTITFDHYTVIFKDTRIWTDSTVLEATIESLLPEAVTVQATATGPFDVIRNDPTFQDPHIAYAFVTQILRDWMHIQDWTTEGEDYTWPYDEEANGEIAVFGNDCHDPSGQFCGDAPASRWDKAQQKAAEAPAGEKHWLNKEGLFVPVKAHPEVFSEEQTSNDANYKAFANQTRAIRIGVSPHDATIEPWTMVNEQQRTAISSHLQKKTVYITSHGPTGPLNLMLHEPTNAALHKALDQSDSHVQGMTPPKSADFLAIEDAAQFGNDCHDPHSGEFCPAEGSSNSAADAAEASQDEYRGQHQPPRDSATIDDLANSDIGTFPSDVYEHPEFYDHTGQQSKADKESAAVIKKVRGNPDAEVTVYRAAPPGVKTINKGDWVAISEAYAREHAEAQAPEGEPPWPVYSAKVPAKFIHSGGNDIVEYGMWHDDLPATIVPKGKSRRDALAGRVEAFANACHDEKGQFCEGDGSSAATSGAGPAFQAADVQRPLPGTVYKNYNKESEEWIAKLTPEEKKAAQDYTGSYLYGPINENAINGTPDPRVDALDRALEKAGERDTPIRVYRRVGFPMPGGPPGTVDVNAGVNEFLKNVKVGQEVPLAKPGAFISTSVTPRYPVVTGWPRGQVLFEINTRHGAAIGNVTEGGGTQKEKELLLPRTSRFRVVGIQHDVQFGPPPTKRGFGDQNKRLVVQVEEV